MLFKTVYRVFLRYPVDSLVELFAAVLDSVSSYRFLDQLDVRRKI